MRCIGDDNRTDRTSRRVGHDNGDGYASFGLGRLVFPKPDVPSRDKSEQPVSAFLPPYLQKVMLEQYTP